MDPNYSPYSFTAKEQSPGGYSNDWHHHFSPGKSPAQSPNNSPTDSTSPNDDVWARIVDVINDNSKPTALPRHRLLPLDYKRVTHSPNTSQFTHLFDDAKSEWGSSPKGDAKTLKEKDALWNNALQDYRQAHILEDQLNQKAEEVAGQLLGFSTEIQEAWQEMLTTWYSAAMDGVTSIAVIQARSAELDRIINIIAGRCKSEVLGIIRESKKSITNAMLPRVYDSLLTRDRLDAVNELRTVLYEERGNAWDMLAGQAGPLRSNLEAIAEWKGKVDAELNSDRALTAFLSKAPRDDQYSSMLWDAASLVTSFAASYIPQGIKELVTGTQSIPLLKLDAFDDVVTAYLNLILDGTSEQQLQTNLVEILAKCQYKNKMAVVEQFRKLFPKSFDGYSTHSLILSRALEIIKKVSPDLQPISDPMALPTLWATQRAEIGTEYQNLLVLEQIASIHVKYNEISKKIQAEVNALTGDEKIAAEEILASLNKNIQSLDEIDEWETLRWNVADAYRFRLEKDHLKLKNIIDIENKKKRIRADIDKTVNDFDAFVDSYASKIDEMENAFGVKMQESRNELIEKKTAIFERKDKGIIPRIYLNANQYFPSNYTEAARYALNTNFVSSNLPDGSVAGLLAGSAAGMVAGPAAGLLAGGVATGIMRYFSEEFVGEVSVLRLSLEELPGYLNRLKAEVSIQRNNIEAKTYIPQAYAAFKALQAKQEAAMNMVYELKTLAGSREAQHYKAAFIQKGLRKLEQDQQALLRDKDLPAYEICRLLKIETDKVTALISNAAKMEDIALIKQLDKFASEVSSLEIASDQASISSSPSLNTTQIELREAKRSLTATKRAFLKSIETKTLSHRKTINDLMRPLRNHSEIFAKTNDLLAKTEVTIQGTIRTPPLRTHIANVLTLANGTSRPSTDIDTDTLEQISLEDLKNYEASVNAMMKANAKHVLVIKETTEATERATRALQETQKEAFSLLDSLDDKDQLVEKAKLQTTMDAVRKEIDEHNERNTSFEPDPETTSSWSIFSYWYGPTYSIKTATEKHTKVYGEAKAKLISAINKSKEAATLTIPEQLELLDYTSIEKSDEIKKELRVRFEEDVAVLFRQGETTLNTYDSAFEQVIGRYYVPANGRFRLEIQAAIEERKKALRELKHEYRITYGWAYTFLKVITFSNWKLSKPINELNPAAMEQYKKEVEASVSNAISTLEETFPIQSTKNNHDKFEVSVINAKQKAERMRLDGQFWYAYQLENSIENILSNFKGTWDNPKIVTSSEKLKELNVSLNRCVLEVKKAQAEAERNMRTLLTHAQQITKLENEKITTDAQNQILHKDTKALQERAAKTIKTKLDDHRTELEKFEADFREIQERFKLPKMWIDKVSQAIEIELEEHSKKNQSFSVDWIFGLTTTNKTIDRLNPSETAIAASKIIDICAASMRKVYEPAGLGFNLKPLRDCYIRYKNAEAEIDNAKEKLIKDSQFIYLHNMENEAKKAQEAVDDLVAQGYSDPTELVQVLSKQCFSIQSAARSALASRKLNPKEQADRMPKDFLYEEQLRIHVGKNIEETIAKEDKIIEELIENINKISVLPPAWSIKIMTDLEAYKDRLDECKKGYKASATSTQRKPLENLTTSEAGNVEDNVKKISAELAKTISSYGLKSLITQYQYYAKQIESAQSLQSQVASGQATKIEAFVKDIASKIEKSADPLETDVAAGTNQLAKTLRTETAKLESELDKIRREKPSSNAVKLRTLTRGTPEYNLCKKEVREFTTMQLLNLQNFITEYDKKIENAAAILQNISKGKTSLPETWRSLASDKIRDKQDTISRLLEGLPHNGDATTYTPFEQLNTEELIAYEAMVIDTIGKQTTVKLDKEKQPTTYTPFSAMGFLEGALNLDSLEKYLKRLETAHKKLTSNIEKCNRSLFDKPKKDVFEALDESFQTMLTSSANSIETIHDIKSFLDSVQMAHASICRANDDLVRNQNLTLDAWTQLFKLNKSGIQVVNGNDQAKNILTVGFVISFEFLDTDENGRNQWTKETYKNDGLTSQIGATIDYLRKGNDALKRAYDSLKRSNTPANDPRIQMLQPYIVEVITEDRGNIDFTCPQLDKVIEKLRDLSCTQTIEQQRTYDQLLTYRNNVLNAINNSIGEYYDVIEKFQEVTPPPPPTIMDPDVADHQMNGRLLLTWPDDADTSGSDIDRTRVASTSVTSSYASSSSSSRSSTSDNIRTVNQPNLILEGLRKDLHEAIRETKQDLRPLDNQFGTECVKAVRTVIKAREDELINLLTNYEAPITQVVIPVLNVTIPSADIPTPLANIPPADIPRYENQVKTTIAKAKQAKKDDIYGIAATTKALEKFNAIATSIEQYMGSNPITQLSRFALENALKTSKESLQREPNNYASAENLKGFAKSIDAKTESLKQILADAQANRIDWRTQVLKMRHFEEIRDKETRDVLDEANACLERINELNRTTNRLYSEHSASQFRLDPLIKTEIDSRIENIRLSLLIFTQDTYFVQRGSQRENVALNNLTPQELINYANNAQKTIMEARHEMENIELINHALVEVSNFDNNWMNKYNETLEKLRDDNRGAYSYMHQDRLEASFIALQDAANRFIKELRSPPQNSSLALTVLLREAKTFKACQDKFDSTIRSIDDELAPHKRRFTNIEQLRKNEDYNEGGFLTEKSKKALIESCYKYIEKTIDDAVSTIRDYVNKDLPSQIRQYILATAQKKIEALIKQKSLYSSAEISRLNANQLEQWTENVKRLTLNLNGDLENELKLTARLNKYNAYKKKIRELDELVRENRSKASIAKECEAAIQKQKTDFEVALNSINSFQAIDSFDLVLIRINAALSTLKTEYERKFR